MTGSSGDAQMAPRALVVMGVSGSGKTTVAALLAGRLGWEFADGDDFHPEANVEKMKAGTPLTDEDRWPWLEAIAAWIAETKQAGGQAVVACSALRRAYRDILLRAADTGLIYLRGDYELIARRQAARHDHFMPTSLLKSQFATLEEPGPDEHPLIVDIDKSPRAIVDETAARLGSTRVSAVRLSVPRE